MEIGTLSKAYTGLIFPLSNRDLNNTNNCTPPLWSVRQKQLISYWSQQQPGRAKKSEKARSAIQPRFSFGHSLMTYKAYIPNRGLLLRRVFV